MKHLTKDLQMIRVSNNLEVLFCAIIEHFNTAQKSDNWNTWLDHNTCGELIQCNVMLHTSVSDHDVSVHGSYCYIVWGKFSANQSW